VAHIVHRVIVKDDAGRRLEERRFRDGDHPERGRVAMAAYLADLKARGIAAERRYEVSARIDGREVSKVFATRQDANAYRVTLEADQLRGLVVDPGRSRRPFKAVAEAWLAAGAAKRRSSVERDTAILTHHLYPTLGTRPIGSITRADVQALVDSWKTTQAPSTVGRQYSCLRAVFGYAEAAELLTKPSPCGRWIRLPSVQLVERPTLKASDFEKLAKALGPDDAPMMWLGATLGLRWAEAAGLTLSRFDAKARTITIDRQLSRRRTLEPPKSARGRRRLDCPAWLVKELSGIVRRSSLTHADDLLFVTKEGTALDYSGWRSRVWVPACQAAGLSGLVFHDLRSIAATAHVAERVPVSVTQARLGHSSSRMTLDVYARATAEDGRQAAEAVGARIRPRTTRGPRASAARKVGAGKRS
jgi:integrase